MLDENAVATATITADVSPFRAALDTAGQYTDGWAKSLVGKLAKLNDALVQQAASVPEKLAALGEAQSEQIGQLLGAGLGAGVGLWFGGPGGALLGSFVGSKLGEAAGHAFDLKPLAAAAGDLMRDVNDRLAGARAAAREALKDVGRAASRALSDAFAGGDLRAVVANLATDLQGVFFRGLERLRRGVDATWEEIKKPLASAVDWMQGALGKAGPGIAKWGDDLRTAGNLGQKAIDAVADALGRASAAVLKFGGHVAEWTVVPLMKAQAAVWEFDAAVLDVAADVADLTDELAVATGSWEAVGRAFDAVTWSAEKAWGQIRTTADEAVRAGKAVADAWQWVQDTPFGNPLFDLFGGGAGLEIKGDGAALIDKGAGNPVGNLAREAGKAMEQQAKAFGDGAKLLNDAVQGWKNIDIAGVGQQFQDAIHARQDEAKKEIEARDKARFDNFTKFLTQLQSAWPSVAEVGRLVGLLPGGRKAWNIPERSLELSPALMQGSRETANFLQQARMLSGNVPNGPAERAAKAAEDSHRTQQQMLDALQEMQRWFKDNHVVVTPV